MERSKYINTRRAQSWEFTKRYSDRLSITINQEPKSKNSILKNEKIEFRNEVLRQLKNQNRRAFRKDIVLQIDFQTTANNPPSVQNLVKNYFDLLHKEMPDIDEKKWLLFKDDNQVKVIIANIYLNIHGNNMPEIKIATYRYSHFLRDLELVERIKYDRFESDDRYDDDFKIPKKEEQYEEKHFFEDYEVEIDTETSINNYGGDIGKIMKEFKARWLQQSRLKRNNLMIDDILNLINLSKDKALDIYQTELEKWNCIFKNLIFVLKDSVEIGESPVDAGQKKIFKERMKKSLQEFKEKNPDFVPLYAPIGITVLFTPPKSNVLDLDNLAKYVIPIITEIFKPPTIYDTVKNKSKLDKEIINGIRLTQNIPKYGIMKYQVVKLDREKDSPENGSISLFISDGTILSNNIWWKVDSYIWDWKF